MKLTNKVTNVFFALFAIIGLFMPIVGYKTALTGGEYNIVDMINLLKGADSASGSALLKALEPYGYKTLAIVTMVAFIVMLIFLVASLILAFTNVPYLVLSISTGLGFASYVTAICTFVRIGGAFVAGSIPLSAISSLSGNTNALSSLLSSFASITQMGITSGAYVGVICLGVMFIVNIVFFCSRKKISELDSRSSDEHKSHKKKSNKKSK